MIESLCRFSTAFWSVGSSTASARLLSGITAASVWCSQGLAQHLQSSTGQADELLLREVESVRIATCSQPWGNARLPVVS
eukprot:3509398-Amphidinium_carterae.1